MITVMIKDVFNLISQANCIQFLISINFSSKVQKEYYIGQEKKEKTQRERN